MSALFSLIYAATQRRKSVSNPKPVVSEEVVPETPETIQPEKAPESGGRGGLEPTRYGDWEVGGICTDF
jgi:hypothetical protein